MVLDVALALDLLACRGTFWTERSLKSVFQALDTKRTVPLSSKSLRARYRSYRLLHIPLTPHEEGGGDVGCDGGMINAGLPGPRLNV
jgi:hypothetical protein